MKKLIAFIRAIILAIVRLWFSLGASKIFTVQMLDFGYTQHPLCWLPLVSRSQPSLRLPKAHPDSFSNPSDKARDDQA